MGSIIGLSNIFRVFPIQNSQISNLIKLNKEEENSAQIHWMQNKSKVYFLVNLSTSAFEEKGMESFLIIGREHESLASKLKGLHHLVKLVQSKAQDSP